MSVARKQAPRPARPAARYWKGKAPKGVTEVDSDSDDERVREDLDDAGDIPLDSEFAADEDDESVLKGAKGRVSGQVISVTLRDVNISRDGKVIVAGREESGRTAEEVNDGAYFLSSILSLIPPFFIF
jgi:microfibrillar-associated protein 1